VRRVRSKAKVSIILLILSLLSSVSCHKKNCVVLSDAYQIKDYIYERIYFLGSISLNTKKCYFSSVKNLPDRWCSLGIFVWPMEDGWKQDDTWKKLTVRMLVKDSRGKRLIDHNYELAELTPLRFPNVKNDSNHESIFLLAGGIGLVEEAPMVTLTSNPLVSRFDPDPTISELDKMERENPDSYFKANNAETYDIYIEVKGRCPADVNPVAKIALEVPGHFK
jgi:hypothetical protein